MEDGSDLRRIANAAGCGYIEKRRKPYVAHMSGAGSAAMIYLQNNVFDEALERLRMIFDGHDDVIVSMSGGKDSTVLFRMALMVAQERGRLPLKVFWLDQEAEWQATVDYMQHVMELPEVTPYWYQIPFEFTNTLSPEKNFISVWNPEDKAIWIHPQHPLSIKENPSSENRFHELVNVLPSYCTDSENCAVLVGMRMTESLNRRVAITQHEARYKGVTWCKKKVGRCQVFWPIYDFTNDDIWTAIAKNHWAYNRVYDLQYQWGLARKQCASRRSSMKPPGTQSKCCRSLNRTPTTNSSVAYLASVHSPIPLTAATSSRASSPLRSVRGRNTATICLPIS
ncbi:MAG: phosphoadenosine phosphosulfate reductase family protein [Oscillospiraceae bacterium]